MFGLGGECTTVNNLELREGHSVSSRFGVLEKADTGRREFNKALTIVSPTTHIFSHIPDLYDARHFDQRVTESVR